MQKETFLVVVSIHEGRNFTTRPKHYVIIECKFDGELLSTDPVPCNHSPDFTTELAWEMDRKALHQHRMQRTPVKLQCYAVDQVTNERESIGYILLDLRGVQAKAKPARWYSLLGKAAKPKPEIKITMSLEDDSVNENQNFKAHNAPPRTVVPISEGVPMKAVLNAEEGYFQVGADSPECEIFILSTTLGSVHNLDKLVTGEEPLPTVSSGYFFYYTLFGSDITNDPFNDLIKPAITPERATVRVRSTVAMLKIYFSQNAELSVHLCCGDFLLGSASIPLGELFSQPKLDVLTQQQIVIKDDYRLYPNSKQIDDKVLHPTVHVSVCLHRENIEVNPVATSSPKKGESKFLNEAAPDDEPVRDVEQQSLVTKPHQDVVFADTDEDVDSIVASDHNTGTKKPVQTQVSCKPDSLTTTATHSNPVSLIHHYRFSLNIKSICKLDLPRVCNLFVKYSYPFFGSSAPVMTKPVEVKRNSEVILPRSLCVFNFACNNLSLSNTFCSTPIHLEVWHRDKETKDVLLGNADLSLSQIIQSDCEKTETELNGVIVEVVKQSCNGQLPIYSEKRKVIAEISVDASLEDFGLSKDYNIQPPAPKPSSPSPIKVKPGAIQSPKAETKNIRETNEYKTAVELELWKSEEQEKFQQRMQEAEAEHLKLLSEEFKQRDREREILVAKRISEYQELEKQLADSITTLEKREKVVSGKETELKRLQHDFDRDVKTHNEEILQKSKQLQAECESKVKLERERRALLEEHNKKLSHQVSELETKYDNLMTNFYDYKSQTTRPEIRLEAELNLARLEKAELERKLESVTKSKLHYKQQWGRTLKELALMKKREQDHARANLRHQQQELEMLKKQAAMTLEAVPSTSKFEEERIERMENELRHLRENANVLKPNPDYKNTIAIAQPTVVTSGGDAHNDQINEKVARLVEERDTLLRTGVYTRSDRIITELDRQISQCMKSGTSF